MEHFLNEMRERFPRLAAVQLTECERDEYSVADTPAGGVETVYFYQRQDFENAVTALAYKLKPRPIPPSMGAIFIDGIADHIRMEKTALVVLGRGGYSGLSASAVKEAYLKSCADSTDADRFFYEKPGFFCGKISENAVRRRYSDLDQDAWEAASYEIRRYHELAHFIQRRLFPENKNAVRDEIKADMTGIMYAVGYYDGFLARLFLGIEGKTYRSGGRLENYLSEDDDLQELCSDAGKYISSIEEQVKVMPALSTPFDILVQIEQSEINNT